MDGGNMNNICIKRRNGKILAINADTGAWYIGHDSNEIEAEEVTDISEIEGKELYELLKEEGVIYGEPLVIEQPFSDELTLLILDTTRACNLACKYCFVDAPTSGTHMTMEIALKSLELALDYPLCADTLTVEFSGGEPLLNFDLIRNFIPIAIEKAKNRGKKLTFTIQTNGTLLNDEIISFLVKYRVNIGISIDGTKEFHDRNRVFSDGVGSSDVIIKNIHQLISIGCKPSILAVISSPEQYDSVIAFAMDNNITEIRTNLVTKAGRAEGKDDFTIDYKGIAGKFISTAKNILEGEVRIHDATLTFFLWNLLLSQPHMCFRSPCGSGKNQISVTSDGNIYPCQGWRNIHDNPISNVLNTKDLKNALDGSVRVSELRTHDVRNIEVCQSCRFKAFCGVCPREIYTEKHTINEKIGFCEFQNMVFEELMWVFDEYSDSIQKYLLGSY